MKTEAYKKQGAVKRQERAAQRQQSASISGVGELFRSSASAASAPSRSRSIAKNPRPIFPEGYFEDMELRGSDPFGY